jgi:hypothetical protein
MKLLLMLQNKELNISGDCKVNYWLPFSSIGDHIATYIKETPLSTKITSLAHAIFFGGLFLFGY